MCLPFRMAGKPFPFPPLSPAHPHRSLRADNSLPPTRGFQRFIPSLPSQSIPHSIPPTGVALFFLLSEPLGPFWVRSLFSRFLSFANLGVPVPHTTATCPFFFFSVVSVLTASLLFFLRHHGHHLFFSRFWPKKRRPGPLFFFFFFFAGPKRQHFRTPRREPDL